MVGKSGSWPDIATEMGGSWTTTSLKNRLNAVVDRRNAIVHEGDYERQERPQTAKPVSIDEAEARGSVDFMDALIEAIHRVI